MSDVRQFLKDNLRLEMDKRNADYYTAAQRVSVKLFLGDECIAECSETIMEGESKGSYY